ncbi:MAG TPA: BamA/TamA family outer membrane protein [Nitrospiraceae bacterium]
MLIYWVGILTIQALLFAPSPADAAEVYGPPNPQQSIPSTQDKEDGADVSPKELIDLDHPVEHALKSLPAKSGYTVIPLPAFATNRNEGYWAGGLTPILKTNSKGDTDEMFVPQYLYNSQGVGHYGSLNYFGYPSDREQYHAFVWYGQKLDQGIDLGYKNVGVGGGRYILAADLTAFKDPFARFFGFGSRTIQAQETNYTLRELLVKLTAGIWLTPDLALMLTERYRNVRVDDGIVVSLPRTAQQFPAIPGIQGAQVLGHGLTLRYDTRDSQLMPTKGAYVNVLAEFNQNLTPEDENQWGHAVLDARQYIPHSSDQMIFVSRMLFEGVFGQIERRGTALGVPFYEQATLGGEQTLRAFGRGRYVGTWAVLANLEERVTVLNKTMFGVNAHLELAPFLDIGRVGQSSVKADHLVYKHLQFSPGVGFRLLIKPTIVGRFDVAYGNDGANVFVGLDYPF